MAAEFAYRPTKRDLRLLGSAALLALSWNLVCWQFPFFWDTVLNSRIAHWYLESGFSSLTVPESMDAGHPPFFNLYLALVWKVTGPELWAAHLAMLPFLLVLVLQFWKLCLRFLPEGLRVMAMLLLFCEPTFLAQSSMVTPDMVLVSLFLVALNAVLEGRRGLLGLVLVGMAAATFRGILAVPAIFLIDVGFAWLAGIRNPREIWGRWRKLMPYLPVAVLTVLWLWLHYRAVGWLLTPPPETYGAHRKLVGVLEILRNLGIVGWRFLDFGRVVLWLVPLGLIVVAGRHSLRRASMLKGLLVIFLVPVLVHIVLLVCIKEPPLQEVFFVCDLMFILLAAWIYLVRGPAKVIGKLWRDNPAAKQLLVMFLVPAALLTALFIPFSNPIGMRYFLVCYLLLLLLVTWLVSQLAARRWQKLLLSLVGLCLVSGHFWIYPIHIAKSWDSSLAYLPFFEARRSMDEAARSSGLAEKRICTDFPLLASNKYTFLSEREDLNLVDIKEADLAVDCECVLWSPYSNGFDGKLLRVLDNPDFYRKIFSLGSGSREMVLYERLHLPLPE